MRRIGPALFAVVILLIALSSIASTPTSGTLNAPASGVTSSVSWGGGPYTGATADPSACTSVTCENYTLTVNAPATLYSANPDYSVEVRLDWASNTNDFH